MEYPKLLDMVTELGYRLAMCGAETFRVEESVNRCVHAYGLDVECFAIPNLLIVTVTDQDGQPLTRAKRIGSHGNDLDGVEKYSNLSRRICSAHPDPEIGIQWIADTQKSLTSYSLPMMLFGDFLGAAGYVLFFGGTLLDMLWGGLMGIVVGLLGKYLGNRFSNPIFNTILSSFVLSLFIYLLSAAGICPVPDAAIIGTLMILVPGLLITNAMRDILYGDTNSGINRLIQVVLIAVSIALGTAAAYHTVVAFTGRAVAGASEAYGIGIQLVACYIGCTGFAILFNIHGHGGGLCILGGMITWFVYWLACKLGCDEIMSYLVSSVAASVYSEIMARIRKYPAISYLVVSIFPLLPGAGIYYTMLEAVNGDMAAFAEKGLHTAGIAGAMALGILIATAIVRLFTTRNTAK